MELRNLSGLRAHLNYLHDKGQQYPELPVAIVGIGMYAQTSIYLQFDPTSTISSPASEFVLTIDGNSAKVLRDSLSAFIAMQEE